MSLLVAAGDATYTTTTNTAGATSLISVPFDSLRLLAPYSTRCMTIAAAAAPDPWWGPPCTLSELRLPPAFPAPSPLTLGVLLAVSAQILTVHYFPLSLAAVVIRDT